MKVIVAAVLAILIGAAALALARPGRRAPVAAATAPTAVVVAAR